MRKSVVVVVMVLSGLFVTNCGSSNNDVCDEAAKIMLQGMKEACQQHNGCCYCTCMLQGKIPDQSQPDQCVCISGMGGTGGTVDEQCTGETEQGARECLNDVAACKQEAAYAIDIICSGGIS